MEIGNSHGNMSNIWGLALYLENAFTDYMSWIVWTLTCNLEIDFKLQCCSLWVKSFMAVESQTCNKLIHLFITSPVAVRSVFVWKIIMTPTDALLTYTYITNKGPSCIHMVSTKDLFCLQRFRAESKRDSHCGSDPFYFNLFLFLWSTEC